MTAGTSGRVYGGQLVQQRRSERRQQFLAAGLEVFGEAGYPASSIKSLCQAAGLARAQFYEHFHNREDLFIAVYDLIQDQARQAAEAASAQSAGESATERVRAAVGAYAESVGRDPRRARIAFVECIGISERVEQHRIGQRLVWSRFMESEMRKAFGPDFVPTGGFTAATTGFIGALMALVHQWSSASSDSGLSDIIDVLTRFLLSLAPH
ncbi:TetR/AcrR family transcriptional regulator [Nocardia inohanensis]|uniref:TetR/AcrR family transcriptional regulator n=1 Tax=Nocardia inohanensis TaxID=209246 RepID=UPI00083179FF|nr:TetR/AcrR family transcriptional regulator [Nocardia inohanensis]